MKSIFHHIILISLLALGLSGPLHAQTPVTFFGTVAPNSQQVVFDSIVIGAKQSTSSELNAMLQPGTDYSLRVTSIYVNLFSTSTMLPGQDDYVRTNIAAISPNGSVRGFGSHTIALSGAGTTQVSFSPGLYVDLDTREQLGLISLIQSNHPARVTIHGFLDKKMP